MTTTVISNNVSYGAMTNQAIGKLLSLQSTLERLKDAIATASAGYDGTPGTEFEDGTLFGVKANDTPGAQGTAYAYAMGRLNDEWLTFWAAAEPFIEQLDNGGYAVM
jgi:hypothetical protein